VSDSSLRKESDQKNRNAAAGKKLRNLEGSVAFPQVLLNVGFGFALALSVACLILSGVYLFRFLESTNTGIEQVMTRVNDKLPSGSMEMAVNGRLVMARVGLLSCGVSAGLSFGFLGFALVLVGVKKEIDMDAQYGDFKVSFARLTPGVLVLLISAVLIGVCVTHRTNFWYEHSLVEAPNTNSPGSEKKENLPPKTTDLNP
jgi:hypothetical protein